MQNDENDFYDRSMIKPEYKYSDITEIIIGCAMKVHNSLGPGFPEIIYQRGFEIELKKTELEIIREKEQSVYYDNQLIGKRRVDFLINNKITVEIKAVSKLDDLHFNQAINYLEAFNLEIGLLINFGAARLEFKRIINNKIRP
jgi:GxxExxY protein